MKESNYYNSIVKDACAQALEASIEALKNSTTGRYIAIPDWEDEVSATAGNDIPISIWAVGLNEQDHLCIKAFVYNAGYGYSEDDFPEGWVDINDPHAYISETSYPDLYRFIVDNLDKATSQEEADKVEWEEDEED